jgi:hypothetical protein
MFAVEASDNGAAGDLKQAPGAACEHRAAVAESAGNDRRAALNRSTSTPAAMEPPLTVRMAPLSMAVGAAVTR